VQKDKYLPEQFPFDNGIWINEKIFWRMLS